MAPADAERLAVHEGALVRLVRRHGAATLPVNLNPAVKPGELFTTFHQAELFLNHVTSAQRDGYVGAPEYKVTAVRLEQR